MKRSKKTTCPLIEKMRRKMMNVNERKRGGECERTTYEREGAMSVMMMKKCEKSMGGGKKRKEGEWKSSEWLKRKRRKRKMWKKRRGILAERSLWLAMTAAY